MAHDPNATIRYRTPFDPELNDFEIEVLCFLEDHKPERGGLGAAGHFRNMIDMLWHPDVNSVKQFIWHPWAEDMLHSFIEEDWVAWAGCASSGKTDCMAVFGITWWLADPAFSSVLFTSTSLKDARKRVWGSVSEYWQAIPYPEKMLPGTLVDSLGTIRFRDPAGQMGKNDKAGLHLIAGEPGKTKEASAKMLGFKRQRMCVMADELSELSEAVLTVSKGNLSVNPTFKFVGASNPNSYYDPFGILATPKEGWSSVSEADRKWRTDRGVCLRFDTEHSPNILSGEDQFPFMITNEKYAEAKEVHGERSPIFQRMFRGWFSAGGTEDTIYAEADIESYGGTKEAVWRVPPKMVAGLDPSFSSNGDRTILYFAKVGTNDVGLTTVEFQEYVEIHEDVDDKETPRTEQVAKKVREECVKRGVDPYYLGVDSTGGGSPFCDYLATAWSGRILRVDFGGAPSDLPVSELDPTKGKDKYVNRVSELWFGAQSLLRSGQIRGICVDLVKEMTVRAYRTRKAGDFLKMLVESKLDMKRRIGKSPDIADAAFILLEVARQRCGLVSTEQAAKAGTATANDNWKAMVQKFDMSLTADRSLIR